MFQHPEFAGHERVVHVHDAGSGLRAIIALHDTSLGPAFGGCRFFPYADDDAALTDVLRLSRGMTSKAAICGLPWGGGKSVIVGDPQRDKSDALLEAMARAVESLQGDYVIADDVGIGLADLDVMHRLTRHTAAATDAAQSPLAVTAWGVLSAIAATARVVLGRTDLAGMRVAIQGLGNVGMPLAGFLAERGARLVVADMDAECCAVAARRFGAEVVAADELLSVSADLLAPCALGGILDAGAVQRLQVRAVCGGANNQLASAADAERLARRGIVFVPDYLVGAGGVIDFNQEFVDDSPQAILAAVEVIGEIAADVLRRAAAEGRTPLAVADGIVAERLAEARRRPRPLRRVVGS